MILQKSVSYLFAHNGLGSCLCRPLKFIGYSLVVGWKVYLLELRIVRLVIAPFFLIGPHGNVVGVAEGAHEEKW